MPTESSTPGTHLRRAGSRLCDSARHQGGPGRRSFFVAKGDGETAGTGRQAGLDRLRQLQRQREFDRAAHLVRCQGEDESCEALADSDPVMEMRAIWERGVSDTLANSSVPRLKMPANSGAGAPAGAVGSPGHRAFHRGRAYRETYPHARLAVGMPPNPPIWLCLDWPPVPVLDGALLRSPRFPPTDSAPVDKPSAGSGASIQAEPEAWSS